ncbi:sporulation membrane protein YtaF [Virgibacillus halodenitrificans]|uniref:sporulation membrane protein YtaF n=1 Tax=Virgibacillus halodenitrificans TaxID=1482 RepID=UPI00030EE4D0|nr:sporulation membrane protein YtaF [Virgibacillus halodenitrificans]MYL60018.1 sporulation membrane protein YtaF [Virgibacillus halodenitrificans]
MLFYTGLLLLVIAVSLDGFGVGITYGMRNIRVPFPALFIIMLCSGVIVVISMTIGNVISSWFTPTAAKFLGGSILVALGLFSLWNSIGRKNVEKDTNKNILTTVLSTPDSADLDQSGTISTGEAFLLGAALALDALGAGIGASMLGYSPVITAFLIACMSGIFLFSGIRVGIILAKNEKLRRMAVIPPVLLITIGILNIIV